MEVILGGLPASSAAFAEGFRHVTVSTWGLASDRMRRTRTSAFQAPSVCWALTSIRYSL
jgi:hypothetical protein